MGQGGRWAKISLLLIFAQELFSDPVLFRFNRNCVCVFVSKIVNISGLSPSFYFLVEDMRHAMSTKSFHASRETKWKDSHISKLLTDSSRDIISQSKVARAILHVPLIHI